MALLHIEVQSRIAGLAANDQTLQPVILDLIDERITVAELIRRTVEEQVRDLIAHRKLDALKAQEALQRQYHYLSDDEIASQAKQGTVRYPSSRPVSIPQIDPQAETEKALAAFEQGGYMILIGGRRVERLDEQITFAPGTKVTFLRVMPLAGG